MQHGGNQQKQTTASQRRSWLYIGIIVVVAAAVVTLVWWAAKQTIETSLVPLENTQTPQVTHSKPSTETPSFKTEVVVSGKDHIWDIAFLPSGEMLFNERKGALHLLKPGGAPTTLGTIADVMAVGEGGLLGMTVDPEFTTNRYIYTCFNSNKSGAPDVRLVRWKLNAALTGLDDRTDIITGMPSANGGRHSGCRPVFGLDGYLWVGTGDAAKEDTPQSPTSLGGKILRVDRDGKGVVGNLDAPFDNRVFSYGHRNTQGVAFFAKPVDGVQGVSAEHGPSIDDEVNLLKRGNFGWAPGKNYNELVPMTDLSRFTDAVEAIWKSGSPTQAPSGAVFIKGKQWKAWDGALAVGMLRGSHLKILQFNKLSVTKEEQVLKGNDGFGRLRAVAQGPDGSLYISTDNSGDDKIIRLIPN